MSTTALTRVLLPLLVALGIVTLSVVGYFELVDAALEYFGVAHLI